MLLLFAGASSAYETALLGLDLVEDRTAEMIESIKADMVRCWQQYWGFRFLCDDSSGWKTWSWVDAEGGVSEQVEQIVCQQQQ